MKIALIGRPNVGKSTLFNRLVNNIKSIVHDTPGVTRDWIEGKANIADLEFTAIDTAGLEEVDNFSKRMTRMTELAIEEADICLFIVDAINGIVPDDEYFARMLHRKSKKVILVINKAEKQTSHLYEFSRLGFKRECAISAAHGLGMIDLYTEISKIKEEIETEDDVPNSKNIAKEEIIKIAVVGRPNAGKSTLINNLIGQERLLTGPEPGITRDSIAIKWQYKGQKIDIIDTAGMRKRSAVKETLEKESVSSSIESINFAHIVILLMDKDNYLESQDLEIADKVIREGRCLIFAINKCDDIKEHNKIKSEIADKIAHYAPFMSYVPVIAISGANHINTNKMIDKSLEIYKEWNMYIPKKELNLWLAEVTENHLLPLLPRGNRAKIKYIRQINNRPPIFLLFSNYPDKVDDPYQRYMISSMRKKFGLLHTPIRFMMRKSDNPYKQG